MKILWDEEGFPPFFEDSPDLKECRRSPLWVLVESERMGEESWAPVEITDPLSLVPDEFNPLGLFLFCEIRLADGTQLEGVVSLGLLHDPLAGRCVGYLELFYEGEAFWLPRKVYRELAKEFSPEEFAHRIGKRLDQITPLTWTSPYRVRVLDNDFPNVVSAEYELSGQIDLLTW